MNLCPIEKELSVMYFFDIIQVHVSINLIDKVELVGVVTLVGCFGYVLIEVISLSKLLAIRIHGEGMDGNMFKINVCTTSLTIFQMWNEATQLTMWRCNEEDTMSEDVLCGKRM